MCYAVYAIDSTVGASNATPMHNSDGTIEGNGGKYKSLAFESSPLPVIITSISPKCHPKK